MVAGSRGWEDGDVIYQHLSDLRPRLVIHGGARGADDLGDRAARRLGIQTKVYPALWAVHGKSAGFRRTDNMLAEGPDLVLAFWDGESPGTAYTIREATRLGIMTQVVYG